MIQRPGTPTTIDELVESLAEEHGPRPALLLPSGAVTATYQELAQHVLALRHQLRSEGVGQDDVVFVSVPHAVPMLVATLGVMASAKCVPVNPAYAPNEVEALAGELVPRAVVVLAGREGVVEELAARRSLPIVRVSSSGGLGSPVGGDVEDSRPQPADVSLVLHTAGTTARPKQVPLTHTNLVAATRNVVASLDLQPDDRCLNVMPLFHSHGLLGAALSTLASGGGLVCPDGMDPRRFLEWAQQCGATWYTAAPTIHQLVLEAPGEYGGFRFMRSASAPLPPQVAEGLERRFGAPMIEVYGMTEAYQIAANPLPPGRRRLGSVGRPTGTEVAVADEQGTHLPPGSPGEVIVRGRAVFGGYLAPPAVNDAAFFGDWFRTGDVGALDEEGFLTITGRIKEQINRGGEKIAPREVDEAVLAHPDVLEAMSFAIPDDQLGEEVGVAVVVRAGARLDTTMLRRFLQDRISPFKVPRHALVVDALPKSSTGKLLRVGFAEQHADELGLSAQPAVVRPVVGDGTTLGRLAALWTELLDLEVPPSPSDRFFDLGGTSLLTMELVTRIQTDLGADLPVVDVVDVPQLGEMAERIDEVLRGHGQSGLLRCYRPGHSGRRVVLLPGQFGMAVGLAQMADAIDTDIEVYLFDYPGNRPGERPLRSVEDLASCLVSEIKRLDISDGLALYGNSLGGWVAFEAARTMSVAGHRPVLVAVGDMYSPFFNTSQSPLRPPFSSRVRGRVRRLRRELDNRRQRRHEVRSASAETRRDEVVAASEVARRNYKPKHYDGDVLVVVASERAPKFGDTLGWERHVGGTVATLRVDAQHSDMHITQAAAIARGLSERLRAL